MQIQGSALRPDNAYRNIFNAVGKIYHEEGVRALYKGLVPGLQRQMLLAGTRLSLYDAACAWLRLGFSFFVLALIIMPVFLVHVHTPGMSPAEIFSTARLWTPVSRRRFT
jgi:hypothetical protein